MKKKNKKVVKIILICVAVVLGLGVIGGSFYLASQFGIGVFNQHDRTKYAEEREYLDFREPFTADYIWIKENGVAVWAAFSKDIELEKDEDVAVLDITCDTYYWLWVNGEEVVWEGCLKRGITPDDGFYDRVEINDKFKKGKNNVSVLVRHLGDDGFSHKDSGHGGLAIEGKIGDKTFVTDKTWKAKKFAYNYTSFDFFNNLNFRLSERGSIVSGEDYTEFWKDGSTDGWDNAVVLDKAKSEEYFGRSYLNPLPKKAIEDAVYFDLSDYDIDGKSRRTMTFELDVNVQFCPVFEFEADKEGRKIVYYTENRALNYKNTYIAKKGDNRFLDFAWINGEKLIVTVDKGVKLKKVGYRTTGYNTSAVQSFTSSDEALTTLWQKSVNTLLVTMRDSYMDCPDRERAEWIGDAVIESDMSFYSLTPDSAALFRKAIVTTYGWVHADGVIQTVVPNGVKAYELPMQNLAFLVGCVNYVNYSGDDSVVPMILSMAEGYLPLWNMKDGLVVHRKGSWDWGDWGKNVDVPALENAWYYYAASRLLTLADPSGDFAKFCSERMNTIAENYSKYYKSNGISSGKKADDRANAVAVLAGLYKEEDKDKIIDTLYNVRNSSPYMEKYVEQALCELGRVDLALSRAKELYADMINDDCSTLWEFWKKNSGTTNHAWAGGTLYTLSRYVGGVYPTEKGFSSFVVKPDIDALKDFFLTLNPVEGVNITVKFESVAGDKLKLTVECSSLGGKLIVDGKNFVYNGENVSGSGEKEFDLTIGVNELIFEVDAR